MESYYTWTHFNVLTTQVVKYASLELQFPFLTSIVNKIPSSVSSPSGIGSQFTIDELNNKISKCRTTHDLSTS